MFYNYFYPPHVMDFHCQKQAKKSV